MDQRNRLIQCKNVAAEHDFFLGQINHQVSAGMRRRPVQQFQFYALDGHFFLILGHHFRGQMIFRRRHAAAGRQRGFLFFLVVLMRNNSKTHRERRQPIHMVAVAVCLNHRHHGLGRNLGNILKKLLAARGRCFGVDHNDALVADYDAAVSAAAFNPVHICS